MQKKKARKGVIDHRRRSRQGKAIRRLQRRLLPQYGEQELADYRRSSEKCRQAAEDRLRRLFRRLADLEKGRLRTDAVREKCRELREEIALRQNQAFVEAAIAAECRREQEIRGMPADLNLADYAMVVRQIDRARQELVHRLRTKNRGGRKARRLLREIRTLRQAKRVLRKDET